jgi:hypothetical protein
VQSQWLMGFITGIIGAGNATPLVIVPSTTLAISTQIAPTNIAFSGAYQFTVAPNSGTTVEITEFVG